ncbi:hypothetical protein U1Q18_045853 [Sarracenia purpurea var. burkii]
MSPETVARTKKHNSKNSHERLRRQASPGPREETFVREGQAEILRLQTNDESIAEETLLHRPDKTYYNHFDTNDTSKTSSAHTEHQSKRYDGQNGAITQIEYIAPQKQSSIEEDTREKPKLHRSKVHVEAEETSAATEPAIQEIQIIDIESSQPSASFFEPSPGPTLLAVSSIPPDTEPTPKPVSEKISDSVSKIGIANYIHHNAKPIAQPDDPPPPPASEPDTFRNILDVAHLEEERNRLTSFQRDILLTRFLVEEQRRYLTQTVDTQSLPGSLSMGTQTDRHRSTQTDVLCLMRPEPRKVKSENDDSSDSEIDTHKKGYRRCYSVIGKDKARYKIRTPIMEEAENTEGARPHNNSSQHRQNKSSILRMTNNRNKIHSREATAEAKSKLDLKHAKNKYKSSNDLRTNHVSLCDVKKSVTYTDIIDTRTVLSDKEMYTPRSLKSRIIARRLSASEPPKVGAHSRRQDYKQQRSNTYEKESHFEPCKKCEERRKEGVKKPKCKHTTTSKSLDQKNTSSGSNTSGETKSTGRISIRIRPAPLRR